MSNRSADCTILHSNSVTFMSSKISVDIHYTVKKVSDFPVPSRDARDNLDSDIPAGDGKIANLFLHCTACCTYKHKHAVKMYRYSLIKYKINLPT